MPDLTDPGLIVIGGGIAAGLACLGAGLGQGRACAAGLEGTARNPGASGKIFTQMTVGLALMESIAIYGFVLGYLALAAVTGG